MANASTPKGTYHYGLGRRKAATATARLYDGKGSVTVNGKPAGEYFNGNTALLAEVTDPLALVGKQNDYDVTILVKGGGLSGQVDAIKLAIAKTIAGANADLRSTLRRADFLSRDPREKERKKYGLRSARKREQYSKR